MAMTARQRAASTLLCAAAFALSGCQTPPAVAAIEGSGGADTALASPKFLTSLAAAYEALAGPERGLGGFLAQTGFGGRADAVRGGAAVLPISLLGRDLGEPERETLREQRIRLVSALDRGGRTRVAERSAAAQANFDCWLVAIERERADVARDCEALYREDIAVVEAILSGGALRVIVLPEADGSIGGVEVARADETVLLDQAFKSSEVAGAEGALDVSEVDPGTVERIFGDTLALLPNEPRSYIVYFIAGSDEPTEASRAVMEEARAYALTQAAYEIEVVGHTDSVGPAGKNAALSLERAERVQGFLAEAGLNRDLIYATGRGEVDPLIRRPDNTPEPENRRVEIVVR